MPRGKGHYVRADSHIQYILYFVCIKGWWIVSIVYFSYLVYTRDYVTLLKGISATNEEIMQHLQICLWCSMWKTQRMSAGFVFWEKLSKSVSFCFLKKVKENNDEMQAQSFVFTQENLTELSSQPSPSFYAVTIVSVLCFCRVLQTHRKVSIFILLLLLINYNKRKSICSSGPGRWTQKIVHLQ